MLNEPDDEWVAPKPEDLIDWLGLDPDRYLGADLIVVIVPEEPLPCKVVFDSAGFFQAHPRLTCNTHYVTLVRQPYMGDGEWDALRAEFERDHPQNKKGHNHA